MKKEENGSLKIYREGTRKLISKVERGELEILEKEGCLWVRSSGREWKLPSKEDFAKDALLSERQVKEKLKDVANEFGVSESTLYKIITDKYPQEATRETCLCALLNRQKIPSLEEVNHTLMTMKRPLLYTATISVGSNCRNDLLIRILTLAEKAERPEDGWALFANRAILYFNARLGSRENFAMTPLFKGQKSDIAKERELFLRQAQRVKAPLEEWERGLLETARQDAPQCRRQVMRDYCAREGISSLGKASQILSVKLYLSDEYIRKMFAPWGRTGCRDSLIACAEAMGCTYRETNLMLREVDAAILYPNSSASDDVAIMARLLRNEKIQ